MVGKVLIYGGKGALGAACVSAFKQKNYWVGSIDLHANEEADENVIIKNLQSWIEQESEVVTGVEKILDGSFLDGIFCVAGGWAGGNAASSVLVKNADMMFKQSVWSSTIAAKLATKFLKPGGIIQLTGAQAALDGTPGMIGYGMAKAAVIQLTKSLSNEGSGLPENSTAMAILPATLDTPMNRKFMPKGDFTNWTPMTVVAQFFVKWTQNIDRPTNGSLIQIVTSNGKTDCVFSH